MQGLLERAPDQVVRLLAEHGTRRAAFVRGTAGRLEASEPWLAELAAELEALPDQRGHEAIFLEAGARSGSLLAAVIHSTVRGQALGGVRHQPYASLGDLLRDGLRLASGMTRKNALAGMWWGGGKGVIARCRRSDEPAFRHALYRDYGAFVSGLRGVYVTAEDAGTAPRDMAAVFETTRFVTCIPPALGGAGNPSAHTAAGVVCAMQAAAEATGIGSLAGKCIAMQGAGQVGAAMIGLLLERGVAALRVAELCDARRGELAERFAGRPVELVDVAGEGPGILADECDVLVPNALGGVLGPKTIPHLRARLVCGAANNVLEDEARDGLALHERGIVFVPDFLANRMGVVSCANEQYGALPADPAIRAHLEDGEGAWEHAIGPTTRRVLARSAADGVPPVRAAQALADELAGEPHPVWPGRGRALVAGLVASGWPRSG